MSKIDVDALIEGVRAQLEAQGMELQGLTLEALRDAMSHPQEAAEVMRAMALEASSVKLGDPAPEFDLPRLGGPDAGERVRLSSHPGKRPVALVDEMGDAVGVACAGVPERLYLVGRDGRIAYKGGVGPMYFRPDEWERAISAYIEG